ncbi:MAG: response regulator [Planctomycetota bacterium]
MDLRILIADDDLAIRQGAAELLVSIGLEVVEAEDGTAALEIVRAEFAAHRPLHLALVDVQMPGPPNPSDPSLDGGLALFDALRGAAPKLPCILWSGAASDAVAEWALRSGASAFLRKPVASRLLRETVRGVLDAHWNRAG